MSSEKGILNTCDRCGATCFQAYIGTKEADGGYTTWNNFKPMPDGWGSHYGIGLLCPACNAEYTKLFVAFMKAGRPETDGA